MKNITFKAFTLAEIMIVLTVVGVLTAILLPAAFHATPDENVMKFKKANTTLGKVITELVTSGEYYTPGDLGVKPDGSLVQDNAYLCETFADVVNLKTKNCSNYTSNSAAETVAGGIYNNVDESILARENVDLLCKEAQSGDLFSITTSDDVTFYFYGKAAYGSIYYDWLGGKDIAMETDYCKLNLGLCEKRYFGSAHMDDNGFDRIYKIFCIDVDGINKGEDPFGYGVRTDGKMLVGNRALEWIEKTVQQQD